MNDYLSMGGYALYVWSSYALAAVVLIGMLALSLRSYRARRRELAQLETGRPRRMRRQAAPPADAAGAG